MPRTFEVTYSGDRASKKRKKFQDGFITVDTDARNQFNISLHSENKKKRLYLGKGKTITRRLFDQEISSFDLVLGQYEVNVASEVGIDAGSTNYIGETESPKQIKRSEESSAFQPYQCDVQILAESKSISELPPEYVLNIDRSLKIKMRPHQIEAAEFLLSALHPINSIGIKNYLDSAKGNKFETEPNQTLVTGAILADSMGLG